jgi:transposase
LVARFNQEGMVDLQPRHAGGQPRHYGEAERMRILAEVRRTTDRERDRIATLSLTTLQRTLREAADGLPKVSIYTIWSVLHDASYTWQRDRTLCETGTVLRMRMDGRVAVVDPDTTPKKAD